MAGRSWKKFRPINKWVVVKSDARVKQTKGGIILTDKQLGVERVMEGTGVILKAGNNEDIRKVTGGVALEPGMRICFRGFLKDAFHEFEPDEDGLLIFMLRAEDVMALIDKSVTMGAFS